MIHRLILGTKATARAPIVLRSLDPDNPATLHGVVWLSHSGAYWTVEDLRIDGRNQWNLPSPIVNGSHSTWRRLDVSNRGSGDGTQPYGGTICFNLGSTDSYGYATDTTIEQSRIHDCGISTNHNHGIYVAATSGTTIIRDNWIYRNGDRGVQLYPAAEHVLVTRNVIDDNGSGVIFSGAGTLTSRNDVVTRNIISNSRKRWNVESWYPAGTPVGTGNIVEGNCLWASCWPPPTTTPAEESPRSTASRSAPGTSCSDRSSSRRVEGTSSCEPGSGCRRFGPLVDPPLWPS